MQRGRLTLTIGTDRHVLRAGDTLRFDPKTSYRFGNEGGAEVVYLLAIVRRG